MTRLTVNGNPIEYVMDPETPLLWALRDSSNLTGTKYGCGDGSCGACTVIVDGEPRRACTATIAALEGCFVTTIEALAPDGGHPLQQAWVAENVSQCGFCTPGMLMAASALLARNKTPSDQDIDEAITNFCPCGTYPRARRAIHRAAGVMRGDAPRPPVGDVEGPESPQSTATDSAA